MPDPAPQVSLGRRERERLARRRDILNAARSVFAERGFVGATLEEIAVRAEFGKGTLYNYFPDGKDQLLFAVIDDIYQTLGDLVRDSFPDAEPSVWRAEARQRFSGFIEECFRYFESQRDLFLILTKEAHRMCFSDQTEREAYFLKHRQTLTTLLAEPVRQAIAAGAMRPLPAEAVAEMLFGNIHGLQMHRALSQAQSPESTRSVEDSAAFLSAFLFDGLLLDPPA